MQAISNKQKHGWLKKVSTRSLQGYEVKQANQPCNWSKVREEIPLLVFSSNVVSKELEIKKVQPMQSLKK